MLFQSNALRIFIIIAVTFICYSFMLASPFKTLDDGYSLVNNKLMQDSTHIMPLFTTGYFQDHSYYRPLTNLSYWLEFRISGLNPLQYNLDNLWLHIANALLVFAFITCLEGATIGFWVALLFAIHPIQWESVANISGRAILLSTFFSLGALLSAWFAIHFRRALAWLLISVSFFIAALLSKESGAIVFILIFGLLFLSKSFYRRWPMLIPFLFVLIAYIFVRYVLGITETFRSDNVVMWLLGFVSFMYASIDLMRLYILPIDLHFDRSAPFLLSLMDPRVWIAGGFWLISAIFLFIKRTSISPKGWFWIAFIVLNILPVAQIVTSIGVHPGRISVAEHFLYFVSMGVFWWIVITFRSVLLKQNKVNKNFARTLSAILLGILMITTIELNMYAVSEYAMIKRSIEINPNNARMQYSLGFIYAMAHNFTGAEKHFQKAVQFDPLNPRYLISYAKSVCDQGRLDECIKMYDSIPHPGNLIDILVTNKKLALTLKNNMNKK